MQAPKDIDKTSSGKPELLNQNLENPCRSDPKVAATHGEKGSARRPSFMISAALPVRGVSGSIYVHGVYAAVILSVLLGIWMYPKLYALPG